MDTRKHVLEAATIVIAAVLCAVVANAFASRERKIALVGNYPNALKVPARSGDAAASMPSNMTRFDNGATSTTPVATNTAPTATSPINVALPNTSTGTTTTTSATAPHATASTAAATTTAKTAAPAPAAGAPAPANAPSNVLARFQPHEKQPYIELHGDDVAALHQAGALFLDARRTSIYEQGHIAGARSFSVWESDVDDKVNKLYEERNDPRQQAEPIVVYCSGGDCEDSHMLAQKLWGVQFNNVYVYKDGWPDWEKRGGPARKGGTP